jgi:hypothetical protein
LEDVLNRSGKSLPHQKEEVRMRKTLRILGDVTYRTQAEAESGMKIIKVGVGK